MRYIQRGPEPAELSAFKAAETADWKPDYGKLTRVEKDAIRKQMAQEQGYLCGYCGCRIGQMEGDCHIEHVEPQSKAKGRDLDYSNMLGSCMGRIDATDRIDLRRKPEHCGEARGNQQLAVTPFDPECATYFSYGSDGRIDAAAEPERKPAARATIDALRLDASRLNAARQAAIDAALDGLSSDDDWELEAAFYKNPSDVDGRLVPFAFAIHYILTRK